MQKDKKEKMHALTSQELNKRLHAERVKLVELEMQRKAGKITDLHAPKKKRTQIARITTELRARSLREEKGGES